MIKIKKISKEIENIKVLDNVSLDIQTGEILVIMGPSGSGKSTLIRNMALIDIPDFGSISIDDKKYNFPNKENKLLDKTNLYPNLTLVFQQFFLWPHLTVFENIKLALKEDRLLDNKKILEMGKLFGIENILDKYPNEVSVGQKQKVSLVRAVILKPKYLILDEVTSALDIESTLTMLSYLNKLKEEGVAIVFVTHALHIAQKIADRVIFLEDGKIIESGGKEILFKPLTDRFKKFIDTPIIPSL